MTRPITPDDLQKLTYLTCVLKETLRILPSVPLVARDLEDDCFIGKVLVLKKEIKKKLSTRLGIGVWGVPPPPPNKRGEPKTILLSHTPPLHNPIPPPPKKKKKKKKKKKERKKEGEPNNIPLPHPLHNPIPPKKEREPNNVPLPHTPPLHNPMLNHFKRIPLLSPHPRAKTMYILPKYQ